MFFSAPPFSIRSIECSFILFLLVQLCSLRSILDFFELFLISFLFFLALVNPFFPIYSYRFVLCFLEFSLLLIYLFFRNYLLPWKSIDNPYHILYMEALKDIRFWIGETKERKRIWLVYYEFKRLVDT